MERLSGLSATYEVHTRFELYATTREALQAAANLCLLLEDGHIEALSSENDTRRETSKTTAYDYTTLLHL